MSMTDPIADMLTRIRNAARAKHKKVDIPCSKMKRRVAELLMENGYIQNWVEVEDNKQNLLRIFLRYDHENKSVISGLQRISKPGLRVYAKKEEIDRMAKSLGITILSTSQGLMSHRQAKETKLSGEVLLRVW